YGGFDRENIKNLFQIALRQLTILGCTGLIILGAGCILKVYYFLFSSRGIVYGASFTDAHVMLWIYRILAILSFVSAVLLVIGIRKQKWKMALAGPVVMIAVVVLGNGIAWGVQNFVVAPDEINKERKYLEHDIQYTKMAYGLDKIEEKVFPVTQDLDKEDLEKNRETIENIRINDYEPAKQFYNQRHGMRSYYHFYDVDVDRYYIDGRYTQVFLSAREIDYEKINQQWINQHLKYTHGYGVALSPVNGVTAEGQPNLLIKDIPPQSSVEELKVTRPEIYFGEMTNNYVITNTKEKEFDYPSGDENVETLYQGSGGISLKGINKILYAIKEKSLKILISGNVTSESKILLNRNIHDRVRKIASFIQYDQDPYLVIHDGKLYWMIDGYTVSNYYPYAKPFEETGENYIRNSVKVVIDAYNGETTYYLFDESDPIIQTLNKIFPQLFTPAEKMPEGLRVHVRYPEKLFNIQAEIYRKYHMSDIEVFYQGEDVWDISKQIYEQGQIVMEPNYFIMKLPGEQKEEFILSLPYTPKNKHNMTGLFIARNDGEHYGKLIIYKFPKEKTVYGPMQIEAKIDQDTDISKEFSLWGQRGSTYLRGNLLTIPIENSLLYVEPIYLKAENENSLPEVKRVVVAYQDRLAYESTLEEALAKMFGTEIKEPEKQEEQRLPAEETKESLSDLI
ncbi:MAG TPA: UPF0182 family protein, partial [Clostridiales bacterium]|nr:UPF0182 family protein [Clostridiales bacterium]